jgi:hypothetical protein
MPSNKKVNKKRKGKRNRSSTSDEELLTLDSDTFSPVISPKDITVGINDVSENRSDLNMNGKTTEGGVGHVAFGSTESTTNSERQMRIL